jgi:hypothetical protein
MFPEANRGAFVRRRLLHGDEDFFVDVIDALPVLADDVA